MKNLQAIDLQKKYKTARQLREVAKHNLRQGALPKNCDPTKTHLNKILVGSADMNINKELDKKLEGVKYRKDAVKTAHMVFSASPEWFDMATPEQIALWEQNTLNYVKDTFGESNILYATVHYDETTPHIHICAVPLVDGKLNMRKLFDGKKGLADNFHTKYNSYVKDLGLERGERYSKANREDIKEYTARLRQSQKELDERIEIFEKHIESCADNPTKMNRLFQYVKSSIMPVVQSLKDKIKAKDKELVKTYQKLAKLEELIEPLREVLDFEEMPLKTDINTLISDLKQYKNTNTLEHNKNIANVLEKHRAPDPTKKDCDSNKEQVFLKPVPPTKPR